MPRLEGSETALQAATSPASAGKAGDHVGLVGDRVEDVADEEGPGAVGVAAEAAAELPAGRDAVGQNQRRVAARADQRAVRYDLDSLPRDPPLLGDVGGAGLALVGEWLVLERVEVKRHKTECRVPAKPRFPRIWERL
jgi:hypothetical protein